MIPSLKKLSKYSAEASHEGDCSLDFADNDRLYSSLSVLPSLLCVMLLPPPPCTIELLFFMLNVWPSTFVQSPGKLGDCGYYMKEFVPMLSSSYFPISRDSSSSIDYSASTCFFISNCMIFACLSCSLISRYNSKKILLFFRKELDISVLVYPSK